MIDLGLWGIVCNAGVLGAPVPDDWLTTEAYQAVLDVNLLGTIRTVHTFRPLLRPMKGRIVLLSSFWGSFGAPSLGPYCVSKFGVEAYAQSLRYFSTNSNVTTL